MGFPVMLRLRVRWRLIAAVMNIEEEAAEGPPEITLSLTSSAETVVMELTELNVMTPLLLYADNV